jgi:hypothetical protein
MTNLARLIIIFVFASLNVLSQTGAGLNRDPKTVKFVTSDIDNFWRAYDIAAKESEKAKRIQIFQTEYLDKGSLGLKDFLQLRIRSAQDLVAVMDQMPKYYASIRPSTLAVAKMQKRVRAAFTKFKSIYPDAVFPDVYFLVGAANSGGTTAGSGLLIGAEMYGKTPSTDLNELPVWLRSVLSSVDQMPGIVAHESCHYNQHYPAQKSLLAKSIQEGSCDFIGELISGQNINERLKVYGRTHDPEIWRDFTAEMDKPDYSNWIYNGSRSKDKPGDLGYYVGYVISRAYYQKAKNKKQAVRDILNIKDFKQFYEASGPPV